MRAKQNIKIDTFDHKSEFLSQKMYMWMTVYYRIDNKQFVDLEKIQKENRNICNCPILLIKLDPLPKFQFIGSDILTDGE